MDYTILVNKDNPLEKQYVPEGLIIYPEYNGEKVDKSHTTMVVEEVLNAFYLMRNEAQKFGYYFVVDSGYRSYEYQDKILQKELLENGVNAYNYVALPGTSEHQSGLAIDVALYKKGVYTDCFSDDWPEIKWLFANAYKYGFILRYPLGKEDITGFKYEFWHFRYVGLETSLYMHENGIETLEEYHDIIRQK